MRSACKLPIAESLLSIIGVVMVILAVGQIAHSQEIKTSRATRSRGRYGAISEIRAAYAAFNRGDFDAAVAALDPKIEWSEPLEFPGGGRYHGRDAVKQYLMQSRAGWAEGSSEPEQFIIVGDRIVVFVLARFRPRNSNKWQQTKLADVYVVRRGRIVRMRAFADRQAALSWAHARLPNNK